MKSTELIEKLKSFASLRTAYMWGGWGQTITDEFIAKKANQYPARYSAERQKDLSSLVGKDYIGVDCVGLIKAILWGFDGTGGSAKYRANGVPDINVTGFFNSCPSVSTDFGSIVPGELVFMDGHLGVYIGDGKVIESTLGEFGDGVVYTDLNGRGWVRHGKCKYAEFETEEEEMKLKMKVDSVGVYVRETLTFKSRKPNGKILAFAKVGETLDIVEPIPGIQADGYQWMRTRYNGVEGYSQFDSKCYYIVKE